MQGGDGLRGVGVAVPGMGHTEKREQGPNMHHVPWALGPILTPGGGGVSKCCTAYGWLGASSACRALAQLKRCEGVLHVCWHPSWPCGRMARLDAFVMFM